MCQKENIVKMPSIERYPNKFTSILCTSTSIWWYGEQYCAMPSTSKLFAAFRGKNFCQYLTEREREGGGERERQRETHRERKRETQRERQRQREKESRGEGYEYDV